MTLAPHMLSVIEKAYRAGEPVWVDLPYPTGHRHKAKVFIQEIVISDSGIRVRGPAYDEEIIDP